MINLLIADDEAIIRRGLRSIPWEEIGVRAIADVGNGLDALELLQGELIDIVLTDIRMPEMDGLELARFIKEHALCTEVILLSGYSDFEYARKGIQYNVNEYLLKPSSPEEIIAAVKRASGQVSKRREKDRRLRMLEAELGSRQLVESPEGIELGEHAPPAATRPILQYIARNYRDAISLSSLSAETHFSSIYLSKVIKRATGYTFLDIVNALRVNDAAGQLRNSDQALTIICDKVGIKDPRYFSQVFKKHYGVTPSAYKKSPCAPLDTSLSILVQSLRREAV